MSLLAVAAIGVGLLAAVGGSSSADVTAVTGSAYGVKGDVTIFGGPLHKDPTPLVTLPAGGGSETQTATPTLLMQFGPAVFFRSGIATVSTVGTTGPTGSVTSSTTFGPTAGTGTTPCMFSYPGAFTAGSTTVTSATANFTIADVGRKISSEFLAETAGAEPERIATIASVQSPTSVTISVAAEATGNGYVTIDRGVGSCVYASAFTTDTAGSTCTADESGITGSTSFTNGLIVLETDDYQNPTVVEAIPANPAPNTVKNGFFILNGATTESFTITFNEQIPNADGSLTVNAAHLQAHGETAVGHTYFGSVTCGASAVATTTTTSTTTTTTTTTVPPTICDAVTTTSSTTSVPGETPSAQVSPSSVAQGGETSVTGDGFTPGESLDLELCSTPINLGTVTADAGGAFLATRTIPADTPLGAHTIVVSNADGSRVATAGLTVVAAGGGGGGGGTTTGGGGGVLSRTGLDSARMAGQAGLALLMGLWFVRAAQRAPSWGHTPMGHGLTAHLRRSLASGAHRFARRRFPWEKRGRR